MARKITVNGFFWLLAALLCFSTAEAADALPDGTVDVSVQTGLTPEEEMEKRGIPAEGISLDEAIEIVLKRSPMSLIADAALLAARQGRKSARGDFFPKLKTKLDYTRLSEVREIDFSIPGMAPVKVPSGTKEILTSLTTLEQPLFTGFAIQARREAQRAREQRARAILARGEAPMRHQRAKSES